MTAMWNRRSAHAARGLIADFEPHVVHLHKLYPQLSVAPVVAAARAGVPIVQTVHDYELIAANPLDQHGHRIDTSESRLAHRILNSATFLVRRSVHLSRVARIVVPSRFLAGLCAARGLSTTVLPNFTELASAVAPKPNGRVGIAFVGRLHPAKGVEDVFEVAERLPSIPVTIAGDGPLEPLVRREALRLRNLTYLGPVDRAGVAETFGASRVALTPSHTPEAGPLVALEAMALGTPVVAYDGGGLAEYVSDASGGLVVPRRVERLVSACREVHENRDLWHQLSSGARTSVARSNSATAYIGRLERVYEEATACAS